MAECRSNAIPPAAGSCVQPTSAQVADDSACPKHAVDIAAFASRDGDRVAGVDEIARISAERAYEWKRAASICFACASSLAACRSNSARVPSLASPALLGNFNPSMADVSRPIRPCAAQMNSTGARRSRFCLPACE